LAVDLVLEKGHGLGEALRYASFQATSVMTTTGYGSADFDAWPSFCRALLVVLMLVGGCSGSTGGGMKVVRVMLMIRLAVDQLFHAFKPEAVTSVRAGGRVVPPAIISSMTVFVLVFIGLLIFGTLVLAAGGMDLVTAGTASVATLSNIGPGLGAIGPTLNYAWMPSGVKVFLACYMLLGRLELFTVLVLLLPSFWRK
jgi:trk system potassium uptake protein TrkH